MEIPFLAWGGLVLHLPGEALGYLAAFLSALLVGMLALRPSLFAILGLWPAATNGREGLRLLGGFSPNPWRPLGRIAPGPSRTRRAGVPEVRRGRASPAVLLPESRRSHPPTPSRCDAGRHDRVRSPPSSRLPGSRRT